MKRQADNLRETRRGMALIVILGFIAILSVLAVSLIVTMRVERLATNSFAETVRTRQLVNVALARAMEAIDADMTNRMALYPTNIYTFTTGATAITDGFPTFESRLYVPQDLTDILPTTVWLHNVTVATNVIGRVGYVAVDMSGLLDANLAGQRQRGRGTSGDEIQLSTSLLSEIRNLSAFLSLRSNQWRRFESIAEMYHLGRVSNALDTNTMRNFLTYSRFGPDLNPDGQPKVSLAGDTNALLARRSSIVAALAACKVPNPENVFSNLLDYVDTDSIPRDLESFTTEAVPMINEVIFSNAVSREIVGGVTTFVHRVYMTVETWFPFLDRSFPNSTIVAASSPIISVVNALPTELAIDPIADLQTPSPLALSEHGPGTFRQTTFLWEKRTNAPIAQNSAIIRLRLNSALRVERLGNRLDLAQFPNNNIDLIAPIPPNSGAIRIQSWSVNDPRLNHRPSDWILQTEQPPTYTAITPGRTNQTAVGGEGVSPMYVRDFPFDLPKPGIGVGTVGELGYLSVGQPWRTIALYNAPPDTNLNPVLDYFTISDAPVRRALVNINSPSTAVIASAFFALPIEAYPGGGGPTVTVAAAHTLASNLRNRLSVTNRYEKNRGISVIGEFDSDFITLLNGQLESPSLTSDAHRESLIRNSASLFGYRQNLFNVYLFAQSITREGATGAEARAVATIWRDPEFADSANKTNKMFIRFFRWL